MAGGWPSWGVPGKVRSVVVERNWAARPLLTGLPLPLQTGSLPRGMNRSLNCHNPRDEHAAAVPACTVVPCRGPSFGRPGPPHRSAGASGPGWKGLRSAALTRLPGQHFGLGERPGRPETPMLVVGGGYVENVRFHPLQQQLRVRGCQAGLSPKVPENT